MVIKKFFLICKATSKDLASKAISFALKSIPTIQAMPATKAAKTAAYLQKHGECHYIYNCLDLHPAMHQNK